MRSGGRPTNRSINIPSRSQKIVEIIDEAIANGARQKLACEEIGISDKNYPRWRRSGLLSEDGRST